MTSSGNKHQRNHRFTDIFYTKAFKEISSKQTETSLFWWCQYAVNINQRDYGLMDGSLHKNFKILVSNSLNRDNQRLNKHKLSYFDGVIAE